MGPTLQSCDTEYPACYEYRECSKPSIDGASGASKPYKGSQSAEKDN